MKHNWICRTWTETSLDGWMSGFHRFETEEDANEFGQVHLDNIHAGELSREYEVYYDFG